MAFERYALRVYDADGDLQYILTDFLALSYIKEVNAPGMLAFSIDAAHDLVGNIDLDWQIEVWRSNPGDVELIPEYGWRGFLGGPVTYYEAHDELQPSGNWAVDFSALFRAEERSADSDGQTTFTAYCVGALNLLSRAVVAYPANTADRSVFSNEKAETIVKTLVQYNATSAGTTGDGRIRDVDISGISIEADAAGGNTLSWHAFGRNLLDVLQEIAEVGGGDFDLIKTGATSWEFRWYDGQRGTDRSATVTFSLAHGNMQSPVLRRNHLAERTVAIVAGQGEEDERSFVVREGTGYDAGVNSTEMFIDARDLSVEASLQARGDTRLSEVETRDELTFEVLQTPGSLYNYHYQWGDLVTGRYEGVVATKQIRRVTITLQPDGAERIDVEIGNA